MEKEVENLIKMAIKSSCNCIITGRMSSEMSNIGMNKHIKTTNKKVGR